MKKITISVIGIIVVAASLYVAYLWRSGVFDTKEQVTPLSAKEAATLVLQALKEKDGAQLAPLVSSTGVRLSPYGHINTEHDRVLSAGEVSGAYADTSVKNWGTYDGSGESIVLTFAQYADKFIYDVDFLSAPDVAENKILGEGNTLINIDEVYPGDTFIEYHFSGFDPAYEGMDWRSLRLIFKQETGEWRLVGISHDQWTI